MRLSMHDAVFYLAMLWLSILFGDHVRHAAIDRDVLSRILRMDAASAMLIAILLLFALRPAGVHYLDAALVLGVLSFVGTLAAVRFVEGGDLFR